ncbi:SdpI family protein [Massilia horti]|uniref:SdpI family protein n=1 Tax=Massilia horti TaxID=2562153 RepID=UPI001431F781|nr:SdpI family protein [Massilia horti]
MKNKYLLLCGLVLVVTFAITLGFYTQLPPELPLHWNLRGETDRYGARPSIFLPSLMMIVFMVLWTVLPIVSPRRFSVDGFRDTWWYTCLVAVAMLGYIQLMLIWHAYNGSLELMRFILGGACVAYALLGNVMGKVRRNFWLGVRTPWTLADERVWYATHRLAAKTMVAGGLLALAVTVSRLPTLLAAVLLMAAILVPAAWSLVYYKRLEHGDTLQG